MKREDVEGCIDPPRQKPAAADIDLRLYICRAEAARSLGYTVSGIRKYEESWLKEAMTKVKGVVYYLRKAVEELREALSDDTAAPCFALFNEGHGPNAVVMLLKHRRPWLVRQYFREYLELLSLEENMLVLELDPGMAARAWKRAHGLPDGRIDPQFIRHALQVLFHRTELWGEALRATAIWNAHTGNKARKSRTRSADDRAAVGSESEKAPFPYPQQGTTSPLS